MALEKIVVEIGGNPSDLKGTLDQLEKIGLIDKKNRESFEKTHTIQQKGIKATGDEVSRLEGKMKNLAERIVAVFAVERIYEFGIESVKAFEEAEKAARELAFTITKVRGESTIALKELIEQSERLSKATQNLYTPKQIQEAERILSLQKLSAEQIKKILPNLLDFAATTNKTLPEAADNFGRAISEGMTKPLIEVGLKFKSTGDPIKDFNSLLESTSKFSGSAEEAMNTLAGQAQITANNLEVLQEKIGSKTAATWEKFKMGILETSDALVTMFTHGKSDKTYFKDEVELLDKYLKTANITKEQLMTVNELYRNYNNYQKLTNDELKAGLKQETEYLELLKSKGEAYSDQIDKIQMLNEIISQRPDDKPSAQKKDLYGWMQHEDDKTKYSKTAAETRLKILEDNTIELSHFNAASRAQEIEQYKAYLKQLEDESKKHSEKLKLDKERELRENGDRIRAAMKEEERYEIEAFKGKWGKEEQAIAALELRTKIALGIATPEEMQAWNEEKKQNTDFKITGAFGTDFHGPTETADEYTKAQKKIQDAMFETTKTFFEELSKASELNVEAIDSQMKRGQSLVDTQRVLAERGLANDLAFEERRQNELEKKKQQEIKKQKRIKEAETFINAMAKFSEDNPKTALAKALGLLAATKAAEAIFAEDGALLGDGNQKSFKGRRHASGRDVLVHAEVGEGILSRKEISALGGKQGFYALKDYLKSPLQEKSIPMPRFMDNSGVIQRLESLEQTIKNKAEYKVEWDGLEYRLETVIKNGITERMKVQRPSI